MTGRRRAGAGAGAKGGFALPVSYIDIRYYDAACAAQRRGGDSELRPARSQRAGSVLAWLESPAGGTAHRSSLAEQQADSSSRRRGRRRPRMADAHAHGSDLRRLRAVVAALAGPEPAAAPRQMAAAAAGRRREPRPPCPPPRWRLRLRQPPTRTHGALASTRVRRCWSSSTERATPSSRLL